MSTSIHDLDNLREVALMLLREVESLASRQEPQNGQPLGLQEEVQRYESELIRHALLRTGGNQRRAAKLLGVKVTTLNCKIKRLGIQTTDLNGLIHPDSDFVGRHSVQGRANEK